MAAIVPAQFITYTRQLLFSLRRTASPPTCAFIHKIADCGVLHYRGTRGGRLTRAYQPRWLKAGLKTLSYDVTTTTTAATASRPSSTTRAAIVPNLGNPVTAVSAVPRPTDRVSRPPTLTPPTLYVFNARSIAKPGAKEQLVGELLGYDVDVAVISESHLKKKHADSSVAIDGYALFRCDRGGRRGGGLAIYARQSLNATVWPLPGLDENFELLWLKVVRNTDDVTFICGLYHPPSPLYITSQLLDALEAAVLRMQSDHPDAHIIIAGDLNQLPDIDIVTRTGLMPIVTEPTRGSNKLDRVYVSDFDYSGVKVVQSTVPSDHKAIVAYTGVVKKTVGKTRRVCTFRKRTPTQHAHFLANVVDPIHIVNQDGRGDPQQEFDKLYAVLQQLLDEYYPERTVTITSSDPPYITPAIKHMLRRKNKLMRAGHVEQADALAVKIGDAIKRHTSAELSRVDVLADSRSMWEKVRELTGRSKFSSDTKLNPAITATALNDHYAAISTDASYTAPSIKTTVNNWQVYNHISDYRMLQILDTLHPTAMGLDNIPAWFLKIGAPFFAAPIADLMNLSLSSSVVPSQWKMASILPIAKIAAPVTPGDYRPISLTPVLSRVLERIVVKDYIYPSLQSAPPGLTFSDQFAFQPTASTTAALIHLFHTITNLLNSNPYVIIYALDFSKAFDSVRHSVVLEKYSRLKIPENIYNWVEAFFRDHSHCTKFNNGTSEFRKIKASIIQGSAVGPASYVVTASDLHTVTSGNLMAKYADDTYLVIPAVNADSCAAEVDNVENWARTNNLRLNRLKSLEIVFVGPRSRAEAEIPAPAVPGFARVESIKILGVTVSRRFSVADHVDNLLAACSQTLFALRTLRHHGLPTPALHVIYQSVVVAKLSYASPAWWGFTNAHDRSRLEAFLRKSTRFGYRAASSPTLASVCAEADDKLFQSISNNRRHLLYPLLPPKRIVHYETRDRPHPFQLPARSSAVCDNNFFMRMLYKGMGTVRPST